MPPMPPVTNATRSMGTFAGTSARPAQRAAHLPQASPLDRQGHAHPAADAEAREALLRVALDHLVDERDQDPASRGADRMPDRDRPTVDVDLLRVPSQLLVHRNRLRGERLV